MDHNDMFETQAEDSNERLEKKEQLRAKVQALVSYYENEKRRNEELTMELERLKAEQQQMQGVSGPISLSGGPSPQAPMAGQGNGGGMGQPGGGMPVSFAQRPQQSAFAPPQQNPYGAPQPQQNAFAPQPQQNAFGAPAEFSPAPQAPGSYTLQGFGAPQTPQGMPAQRPPMPQQPQAPYGAPQQAMPSFNQPGGFQPPQPAPYAQPGFPQAGQQNFSAAAPQGMPGYPPQAPAYQGMGLTENIGTVLQTITQVRSKLHQFESIRGYNYPQQPAYVDYDTVALLDKLYDQLGDLSRELMQRR